MKKNSIIRWWQQVRYAAANRKGSINSSENKYRRDFCYRYQEILCACDLLETQRDGRALAQKYMQHVLEHQRLQWWTENAADTAQPWFVWQYMCEHGLVTPPVEQKASLNVKPILPDGEAPQAILLLHMEREVKNPEQGLIHLHCAQKDLTEEQAKQLRCRYISGGYVRKVDECAAPIMDRAVQMGVMLLNQGFGVCVQEQALYERILCYEFEPEHLYWVRAAEAVEWLRLTYPYNVELHGYLLQMGGRWTGKQMLLPVTASDRLRDIIRLYNFRMTVEAQRRLALWEEACRRATIYKPRRLRNEPSQIGAVDLFRQMLEQKADVPADLIDPADG